MQSRKIAAAGTEHAAVATAQMSEKFFIQDAAGNRVCLVAFDFLKNLTIILV